MKRSSKISRFLASLVIVIVGIGLIVSINAYQTFADDDNVVDSGEYWTLYDDGTLELTGMQSYKEGETPWGEYNDVIVEVVFNSSISEIGDYAFSDCSNLLSVSIPDGVSAICQGAFANCTSLKDISFPDGLVEIDREAFSNCRSLEHLIVPDSVLYILNNAFLGCSSLSLARLPEVTFIGDYAFSDCSSLEVINLSDSLKSIGQRVFNNCSKLDQVTIPDSVTSIGSGAFYNCSGMEGVELPDNLQSIGREAFSNCSSLDYIELPASLTDIEDYAFSNCSNLERVDISDGMSSLGNYMFSGCSSLESIEIPDSVANVGYSIFNGCSSIQSITAPFIGASITSDTSIGYLFGSSDNSNVPKSLDTIVITGDITSISDNAFALCSGLTSINLPDSVTSIGDHAFSCCSSLAFIKIPDNVTSIGESAFLSCSELSDIVLPNKLTSIGPEAFSYCSSLPEVILPDGITSVGGYAFSYCSRLGRVEIPDSITAIGNGTFYNCKSIGTINLPESLTGIGSSAFEFCSNLNYIFIPGSVTTIGSQAFYDCSNLRYAIFYGSAPVDFGSLAFDNCTENFSILCDYRDDTWSTPTWNGYSVKTYEEIDSDKHVWSHDYIVDIPPTCSSYGRESIFCFLCNEIRDTRTIEKTDHSFGDWTVVIQSSCEEEGWEEHVCGVCGFSEGRIISANGHEWDKAFTIDAPPTCTTEGSQSIHCKNCDAKKDAEKIPVLEHAWQSEYTVDKKPTCEKEGVESIHCSLCNAIKEGSERSIEKSPHTYGKWKTVIEPACTAEGTEERECTVCNKKEVRSIPAIGHKWSSTYIIDKAASYDAAGSKSIHCSVCNTVKSGSAVYIPKLTVKGTSLSNVSSAKKGFTAKWKKGSDINGYEIQYALNSKFTKSKKTVKVTKPGTVSRKITKLKSKKKYYVRIRTYKTVNGKKYYSAWSKSKTIKTK